MNTKITVHGSGNTHFLRFHLKPNNCGVIRFESEHSYTKTEAEADYRAMLLSSKYGFERDELPTHPETEVYPSMN